MPKLQCFGAPLLTHWTKRCFTYYPYCSNKINFQPSVIENIIDSEMSQTVVKKYLNHKSSIDKIMSDHGYSAFDVITSLCIFALKRLLFFWQWSSHLKILLSGNETSKPLDLSCAIDYMGIDECCVIELIDYIICSEKIFHNDVFNVMF